MIKVQNVGVALGKVGVATATPAIRHSPPMAVLQLSPFPEQEILNRHTKWHFTPSYGSCFAELSANGYSLGRGTLRRAAKDDLGVGVTRV